LDTEKNGRFWFGNRVLAAVVIAAAFAPASPIGAFDMPPARQAISQRMRPFVESGEIAGAVTLVADREQVLHLDSVGSADLAAGSPMKVDSIFWIASMTKPVTAAAVMLLSDDGLLSVDDPVHRHLPEFAALKTADGKPASVTIRHILTHTSGMGEITPEQAEPLLELADVMPYYVSQPLQFQPGSQWVYCQSGINTAGRIVEVVSGKPLVQFLKERLFDPLGMKDTTYYLTAEQQSRLATSYRRTEAGKLEPADIFILLGKSAASTDRFPAANGGLFSTAADYARFCRMILNQGELDGKRYLRPETVRLMTTIQTGDLTTGFTDGNGWGLGWCVVRRPQGVTAMLSPGTHGHGGAYGTQAWIDPHKQRIYILMVQRENFQNADDSPVRLAFQDEAAR
jgi:CubicO group peptidase (beta-lactamase class C family)